MASKLGNDGLGSGRVRWIACGFIFAVAAAPTWAGFPAATLTLVPVEGTGAAGGQLVTVEAFMTPITVIRAVGGQWDLPCTVNAQPGGSGTMTSQGGCTDCDGNGSNSSSGGIPFLFGPTGLSPHAIGTCVTATTPGIGLPSVVVQPGVTRYLGTVRYLVGDYAAGEFNIHFECTDQPNGLCDSVPELTNSTRYRHDDTHEGILMRLFVSDSTITVPIGACCDGLNCLEDHVNDVFCIDQNPPAFFVPGRTCDDIDACVIPCCLASGACVQADAMACIQQGGSVHDPGEGCFSDADGDGFVDICDNCLMLANPGQSDCDGDAIGDACESAFAEQDDDSDGVCNGEDNCPTAANADQFDADSDGSGNACDTCPSIPNPNQADTDGDEVGNACDNCPLLPNLDQADCNGDGVGDACASPLEQDDDGDSVCNGVDQCPGGDDRIDDNGNGVPDECEVCGDGDCDPLEDACTCPQDCGGPATCDDGLACTEDSCNPATAACEHLAQHTACDDGLFCTGVESCDVTQGCVSGGNPCGPGLDCDEVTDSCVVPPIPTVSSWGLVVLALLFLSVWKVRFALRSSRSPE